MAVIVTLKDLKQVVVPEGNHAEFSTVTERIENAPDRVVQTVVEVKDSNNRYGGKVVAQFKAEDILYFTVDDEYVEPIKAAD